MDGPQWLGGVGGVGNWLLKFVFRMRWEHLSFAVCFVFDTILLGLEPDNSAQSLECTFVGIKTSHSDLLGFCFFWFLFFSFLFFFFLSRGGREVTMPQKGGCLH